MADNLREDVYPNVIDDFVLFWDLCVVYKFALEMDEDADIDEDDLQALVNKMQELIPEIIDQMDAQPTDDDYIDEVIATLLIMLEEIINSLIQGHFLDICDKFDEDEKYDMLEVLSEALIESEAEFMENQTVEFAQAYVNDIRNLVAIIPAYDVRKQYGDLSSTLRLTDLLEIGIVQTQTQQLVEEFAEEFAEEHPQIEIAKLKETPEFIQNVIEFYLVGIKEILELSKDLNSEDLDVMLLMEKFGLDLTTPNYDIALWDKLFNDLEKKVIDYIQKINKNMRTEINCVESQDTVH